ncbi:MAG: CHRD domain-containing protein, partial [Clostridia bacterium]|nr:CHRD domain-containing protein [Deltaproteobacteria bacterium]
FSAHLTGDQEVPAVATNATGQANYQLSKDFSFFPQGTFYFTAGGGDVDNDSVGVSGFTPVLWHLAEHFFIGAGPDVLIDFNNDAGERFRLGAQSVVGGWF